MHKYRTHKCNELRIENVNDQVKLSGWVHRKRDHGQLIFVDLRDHYGLTQVVVDSSNKNFSIFESLPLESVITVSGIVVERSDETITVTVITLSKGRLSKIGKFLFDESTTTCVNP